MTICASLCYIKKNRRTLMLHRVKKKNDIHKGKWNGLGGKIEPGETPEECVIREVKEESGLAIRNPKLCGLLTFPLFDGANDWIVFVYTARQFSGRRIECDEGHLEWIPDHKLLKLPLWEGDAHFLKWIEQKRFFSAKFIYRKKRLVNYKVLFYN